VVLNPPYGKRLGKQMDMTHFFSEIGKKLAADFKGWRVESFILKRHWARP